jgi:hypothetical protein
MKTIRLTCQNGETGGLLGPHWFAKTKRGWVVSQLAYLLLDPAYYNRIILNSTQSDHCKATGKFLQYIPHGEVWIDNHVPLNG